MSNYKLSIQIDGNATNIMRLPCVAECYKGTDPQTGDEHLCYHLRGGVYKRLDEYPFRSTVAFQGDWLCLDQQGRWHCLTNEQYKKLTSKSE